MNDITFLNMALFAIVGAGVFMGINALWHRKAIIPINAIGTPIGKKIIFEGVTAICWGILMVVTSLLLAINVLFVPTEVQTSGHELSLITIMGVFAIGCLVTLFLHIIQKSWLRK
jgi:hypothetical protein